MSRRILAGVGISLIVSVVMTALTIAGYLATFDETVSAAVHAGETPALTIVLLVITNAGTWFVYAPISLVLLAIPRLRWRIGFPVTVTLTVAGVLNWILKQLFAVPRPDVQRLASATGFSFPSGHAMSTAAFIGIGVLLFVKYSQKEHLKTLISVLAVSFVLGVGFSRVYLGVHNPSDVVTGYAMGFLLALLALGVVDVIEKRRVASDRRLEIDPVTD